MKILAIRGCNLASLAGEFEIDLAHGPLGAAGVFAIVGPTGAGKSTLLDAMCVALFDRTPRLANRSTVVVGRGDDDPTALGAQDVRSLLRRGASAGYAEVDFESGDARRYRARWSVRRARNATDGRFQNQQVTLTAIDGGEQLGGTKTETLEAIHQRLGLSFDQFRRSALLAQGDFAAFLRADGKDRSELLERMTGTEIYSKLSVAAHLRAALAEQQLRERHGAALAIPVLAHDERARMESELAVAKQAQLASRARLAAAEAAARWLAEHQRREHALADAEAARRAAEAAVEHAAIERAELALRRRAETLRSVWEDAARLDRQLTSVRSEAIAATESAAKAEATHREITASHAHLVALHAPIRDARMRAGLVEKQPTKPARDLARDPAHNLARDPAHNLAREFEPRAKSAATDAAWLLARADLGAVVIAWPELDARLAQQAQLAAEIAASDKLLFDRARHRDQLTSQRKSAVAEHQQALARLTEAQAEAATYHQKRGLSLDAARRAEDDARTRSKDFERLTALVGEARGAATARAALEQQLDDLATAATTDAESRATAERDLATATLLRTERTRILDELRKAAGYTHARTELVDGDPCPLCGAEDHPWKDRGSFDALILDAQSRLAEAAAQNEAAVATLATLSARGAHRAKEHARLTAHRSTAETTAREAAARWREQLAALGELLLVDDPASDAAQQLATERAEAARSKLEAARAARSQAEAVAKAAADAQGRVQTRQADVEHHTLALRQIDGAIASLDAAVERLRGERNGKVERLADLLTTIDAAFARWLPALDPSDAAHPLIELAREGLARTFGSAARTHVGTPPIATAHTHVGTPPIAAAHTHVSSAPFDHSHAGALLDRCRRALADVTASWSTHAERVASLDAELAAALASIETAAREAERILAEQLTRRDTAAARRDAAIAELADARTTLDTARISAGFDVDELRRLLSDSPARAEDLAAKLDTLDRALDRARTLVAERQRLVADHAAVSPFNQVAAVSPFNQVARPGASAETRDDSNARPTDHADALRGDHADARPTDHADALRADHADALRADHADARRADHADARRADHAGALRVDHAAALRADAANVPQLAAAVSTADHHAAALAAALAADTDARVRRASALAELAAAEQAAEVDRVLGEIIGSHDGKLFRSFAQSLTLDSLLAVANSHLEELAPRYQLERVPKHDLELQVIDRDLGNEIRSVQSLSGGESFLVSLALALGLSSMSAHDVRVRTLLIDEGFGTLDPATLDSALAVLDALQATGRQVGVISHVPALVERVGAHVRIRPRGGGKSEVVVAEA